MSLSQNDNEPTSNAGSNTTSDPVHNFGCDSARSGCSIEQIVDMEVAPGPSTLHASETPLPSKTTLISMDQTVDGSTNKYRRWKVVETGPWTVDGALLSALSVSTDAAISDGSKAVRAKGMACSLRILEAHGGDIQSVGCYPGVIDAGGTPVCSDSLKDILAAVSFHFKVGSLQFYPFLRFINRPCRVLHSSPCQQLYRCAPT